MTDSLGTDPLNRPDDFRAALKDAHRGLDRNQIADLNARLVLLLADRIGDPDLLRRALAEARAGVAGPSSAVV